MLSLLCRRSVEVEGIIGYLTKYLKEEYGTIGLEINPKETMCQARTNEETKCVLLYRFSDLKVL